MQLPRLPSWADWFAKQATRPDAVGALARYFDRLDPTRRWTVRAILRYLFDVRVCQDKHWHEALDQALRDFESDREALKAARKAARMRQTKVLTDSNLRPWRTA